MDDEGIYSYFVNSGGNSILFDFSTNLCHK